MEGSEGAFDLDRFPVDFYCDAVWNLNRALESFETRHAIHLVNVAQEEAARRHISRFLVRDNALRSRYDKYPDISRGKVAFAPLFEFWYCGRESRPDTSAVVDSAQELDLELSAAAIINKFELTYIAVFLHHSQDLAHKLRGGIDDAVVFVPALVVEYGREHV